MRQMINGYLDGELNVVEVSELQGHLGFCECCAAELEELGRVRQAMAAWGTVEESPPVYFAERVVATLVEEQGEESSGFLHRAFGGGVRELDAVLGRVSLPGGRSLPVRSLIGWGLAIAALLIGIERRHVRRVRQLKPS